MCWVLIPGSRRSNTIRGNRFKKIGSGKELSIEASCLKLLSASAIFCVMLRWSRFSLFYKGLMLVKSMRTFLDHFFIFKGYVK